MTASHPIDIAIFNFFHSPDCAMTTWAKIALFMSDNSIFFWFALVLLIGLIKGKSKYYPVFVCITGFLFAWFFTDEVLKPIFDRPRPPIELHTCAIGIIPRSPSFPSGHTITSFTIAMLIYLFNKKNYFLSVFALVFAIFNGYLRVFLGVHFPTDILVAAISGILIGYFWFVSTEFARKNYKN